MRISGEIDFKELARCTPGFVGADLAAVAREAAVIAVNRSFQKLFSHPPEVPVAPSTAIEEEELEYSYDQMDSSILDPVEAGCVDAEALDCEESGSSEMDIQENAQEEDDCGDEKDTETTMTKLVDTAITSIQNALHDRSNISDNLRASGTLSASQLEGLEVTMGDFNEALPKVQPSAKREGFATVPNVSWNDIGALAAVREELMVTILAPIRNPQRFADLGLSVSSGILLYGPPGCGKTLLAKAIANESGSNFISVKGPELLNKYVGESEKAVRQVFQRANASAPCIIFFDELDALAPRRGTDGGGGGVSERVVNQLLTEMDGLETRKDVFVIAATNRPDIIDPAILRPGRLDKTLYVPLPTPEDRFNILVTLTRRTPLSSDVDLKEIAFDERCQRFSGADLSQLVREASFAALRPLLLLPNSESITPQVSKENFDFALSRTKPSVSVKDFKLYMDMQDRFAGK